MFLRADKKIYLIRKHRFFNSALKIINRLDESDLVHLNNLVFESKLRRAVS